MNIQTFTRGLSRSTALLSELVFLSQESGVRFRRAWAIVLFLSGLVVWGHFVNWGRGPFTYHDWASIYAPRAAVLTDAIVRAELPLHINNPAPLNDLTDRFLAIPDQILSPQILLLPLLGIGRFFQLHIWLLYSAGFLGLLQIAKRYRLSPFAFTALFLLFNFNGHIVAHFGVGHATWGGYFLLPWFIYLVLVLLDSQQGWGWSAGMAILLFTIYLQGSFHQFVWALLFLAVLALVYPKKLAQITAAGVFALLLSAVRILPSAITYTDFSLDYRGGYPSLQALWLSLVSPTRPLSSFLPGLAGPIGSWEFTLYLGLTGTLLVLLFGVAYWFRSTPTRLVNVRLAIPLGVLLAFSFTPIFQPVYAFRIPFLGAERISSRMASLALVFLIVFASLELQRWLERRSRLIKALSLLILAVMAVNLWVNLQAWQVVNAANEFPAWGFNQDAWVVANRYHDLPYLSSLLIGSIISLAGVAGLVILVWQERRAMSTSSLPQPKPVASNSRSEG